MKLFRRKDQLPPPKKKPEPPEGIEKLTPKERKEINEALKILQLAQRNSGGEEIEVNNPEIQKYWKYLQKLEDYELDKDVRGFLTRLQRQHLKLLKKGK